MFPPFGASCAAFDPEAGQQRWLEQVSDPTIREHLRRLLDTIRRLGVAVWRLDQSGQLLQDAVAASNAVAPKLGLHRGAAASDRRIAALSIALGRAGYTADELRAAGQPFAISYIAGTVFDELGRPCYSLELHVLRTDVSYVELRQLVRRVRSAPDRLTVICGGQPDRYRWAAVGDE
jgi:DNA-binding IclR family transcriptional regulator